MLGKGLYAIWVGLGWVGLGVYVDIGLDDNIEVYIIYSQTQTIISQDKSKLICIGCIGL